MFMNSGAILSEIIVEQSGHTENDFLCCYQYKDEYEPEENKRRFPNKKDRQYEGYMCLSTITQAKRNGAKVDIETYKSDTLEWNEEYQKYMIKKHLFDNEDDYYKQFKPQKP